MAKKGIQTCFTIDLDIKEMLELISEERFGGNYSKTVRTVLKKYVPMEKKGFEVSLCEFGNYINSEERKNKLISKGVPKEKVEEMMKIVTIDDVYDFVQKV